MHKKRPEQVNPLLTTATTDDSKQNCRTCRMRSLDCGEKKFLVKFNARIYANDRRDTWFLKVGDNCAFELPKFVAKSWLQHERSISDVYQYWKEHR